MSFKPEMLVEGEWYRNSLCFPTEWEAAKYGRSLMDRWLNVMDRRVVEIGGLPANYHYVEGVLQQVQYTKIADLDEPKNNPAWPVDMFAISE